MGTVALCKNNNKQTNKQTNKKQKNKQKSQVAGQLQPYNGGKYFHKVVFSYRKSMPQATVAKMRHPQTKRLFSDKMLSTDVKRLEFFNW